jgi:hypothetical protein
MVGNDLLGKLVQPDPLLQYYIRAQHWLNALATPLERHMLKLADTVSDPLSKPIPPPTDEIPPPPLGPSPPSTTRRPSRRTLVLSVIAVLVAISVVAAGYYGTQYSPSPDASVRPSSTPTPSWYMIPGTTTLAGKMVTYKNPQIGVKFVYPQNWTVTKDPTFNGTVSNCFYLIYPPHRNNTLDSVSFYKIDKQRWLSDNDNDTTRNYIGDLIYYWNIANSNITYIQNATTTILGGVPAYRLTVSLDLNKNPNDPHVFTRWFVTKGDYIYMASYECFPTTFNRTLDTAEQIVYSFEFI